MMEVLPVNMLEKAVMVCWGLWENRNAKLWSNQYRDPTTLVRHALFYAQTWQNLNATWAVLVQDLGIAWSAGNPHLQATIK